MNKNGKINYQENEDRYEISLIIPCLNEEQNVPSLVEKLQDIIHFYGLSAEIIIVDDLSDDYTFKEALIAESKYPNVYARHKGWPRGIGNAIKFGVANATGKMGIVVMGDLVDPLHAIPDFRQKIIEENYDLALLSRYIAPEDSGSIPKLYKFYQWWFRLLCRILLGIRIKDITYAYRAFSIEHFKKMKIESGGFEISPELTIKSALNNSRIIEIRGRQGRRISGETKFAFSRAGWGYARVLLKGIFFKYLKKWPALRKKFFSNG